MKLLSIKNSVTAASIVCVALLSACGEDKPSDKLAAEVVRPYAEKDLLKGMEVSDYKRDNGWVDADSPNRYKVQFTLNYRLTKPLPEVVLENAKDVQAEHDAQQKNPGFMGINALGTSMQINMIANDWINVQGDNFTKRRDALIARCEPCIAYWNQPGSKDEIQTRRATFIVAWAIIERLGFKDDAEVGDKVPRSAWAIFTKTEKGWQATS